LSTKPSSPAPPTPLGVAAFRALWDKLVPEDWSELMIEDAATKEKVTNELKTHIKKLLKYRCEGRDLLHALHFLSYPCSGGVALVYVFIRYYCCRLVCPANIFLAILKDHCFT
jgi:hypothetical protein